MSQRSTSSVPALSVVVPLLNEEASIAALVEAVCTALEEQGPWELVLVDDGSTDATVAIASRFASRASPTLPTTKAEDAHCPQGAQALAAP